MQVLPAMKRLGPVSYVLGASTELFNELILLRWTLYADLAGMTDLLDEMRNQGVEINDTTIHHFSVVARIREEAKKHERLQSATNSVHVWWRMMAVEKA